MTTCGTLNLPAPLWRVSTADTMTTGPLHFLCLHVPTGLHRGRLSLLSVPSILSLSHRAFANSLCVKSRVASTAPLIRGSLCTTACRCVCHVLCKTYLESCNSLILWVYCVSKAHVIGHAFPAPHNATLWQSPVTGSVHRRHYQQGIFQAGHSEKPRCIQHRGKILF